MTVLQRGISRDNGSIEEKRLFGKVSDPPQVRGLDNFWICLIAGIFFINVSALGPHSKLGFVSFAVLYTLGVTLLLGSTCFLMRPLDQVKQICSSIRWLPILIFIAGIMITFVVAAVFQSIGLILTSTVIQSFAIVWYSLSYMPHARGCAKKGFIRFCGCFSENATPSVESY